jgi:hypothetical protein
MCDLLTRFCFLSLWERIEVRAKPFLPRALTLALSQWDRE